MRTTWTSREKVLEKTNNDWKYMEAKDPTSIKHLEQWKKDFDFDGKLNSISICRLIGRIEQKTKNNPKKAESLGLSQAQKWLIETQKRKRELIEQRKQKMLTQCFTGRKMMNHKRAGPVKHRFGNRRWGDKKIVNTQRKIRVLPHFRPHPH